MEKSGKYNANDDFLGSFFSDNISNGEQQGTTDGTGIHGVKKIKKEQKGAKSGKKHLKVREKGGKTFLSRFHQATIVSTTSMWQPAPCGSPPF